MDILEELPIEQWPVLQEKVKRLWPINVAGYYALHANVMHPEIREAFNFKVYCPRGNMDNGFVATHAKHHQYVIIFPTNNDTSKIEEAILKTKLLDWSKLVFFNTVTTQAFQAIERIRSVMQFEKYHVNRGKAYFLPGTTKQLTDLRQPDNTYLAEVRAEDIHRVDDTWPYKNKYSHDYFSTLAANHLSYGLYSTETNELLAWVFLNEYYFLLHFYCEEKHRRRGYGEYVLANAVNQLLKSGHDAYAYVMGGNTNPVNIFTKFGFKIIDDVAFVYTKNAAANCPES